MIKRPTVLVLGAGASKPYNYPTGQELLRALVRDLANPSESPVGKMLYELGVGFPIAASFSDELARSESPSVDAFLECRDEKEYLEIGKLAMTIKLWQYERKDALFSIFLREGEQSWYQYLFNKMVGTKLEDFGNNDLSIITFNYDRSLEFYWYEALANRFGRKHETKVKEMLKRMRIVHVHGRLGEVPWDDGRIREYDGRILQDRIKALSERIIVISEIQKTSNEFDYARKLLSHGKAIYFLGFGYHPKNLERLDVKPILSKRIVGSSLGLEQGETGLLTLRWGIEFPKTGQNILELIRGHYPLDV